MVRYAPDFRKSAISNLQSAIGTHWTVLFETSADRDPLLARAQIEVTRHMLAHADPADTFTLLTANTRVQSLATSLAVSRTNIDKAIASLEKSHLIGALDLGQAIDHAAGVTKSGVLLHVGSGIPAMGEKRHDVLARKLSKGTQYIGIGVGRRWNRDLMKLAAEKTGGLYAHVNPDEPLAWRAFEIMSTLRAPRLLDVQVADAAGEARFLAFNHIVAQGEEIAAVARVPEKQAITSIAIRGMQNGKPFERILPVKDVKETGHLPRTWAKLEIDRLLAEDAAKHKESVIALSKAMYVMTPFTSLLVLENDDMYAQYKVDRGRKDHWAMYPCPPKIAVVHEPEDGGVDWKAAKKSGKLPAKKVLETIVGTNQYVRFKHRSTATPAAVTNDALIALPEGGILSPPGFEPELQIPINSTSIGMSVPPFGGFPSYRPGAIGIEMPDHLRPARVGQVIIVGNDVSQDRVIRRTVGLEHSMQLRLFAVLRDIEHSSLTLRHELASRLSAKDNWTMGLGGHGVPMGWRFEHSHQNADRYMLHLLPQGLRVVQIRVPQQSRRLVTGSRVDLLFQPKGNNAERVILENVQVVRVDDSDLVYVALAPEDAHKVYLARELGAINLVPHLHVGTTFYKRPTISLDDSAFVKIAGSATGLHATSADILAILEAEALPTRSSRRGKIDAGARELLDQARKAGWRSLTRSATTIRFDGQGRFAYERELPPGIREVVICDGKTLMHVYPQLGIAAQRPISRFHRLDLAEMLPWFVPSADDLAHGADVKLLDDNTVAVVPHVKRLARDTNLPPSPQGTPGGEGRGEGGQGPSQRHDALARDTDPLTPAPLPRSTGGEGTDVGQRSGREGEAPAEPQTEGKRDGQPARGDGEAARQEPRPPGSRPPASLALHFIFSQDGRLAEKRLVRTLTPGLSPGGRGEIVSRLILAADGTVTLEDGKGKVIDTQKAKLAAAEAPNLSPDTKDLVVLPLPFRTAEHVKKALKIEEKAVQNLTFAAALPLFAAHYAAGNGKEADAVFRQVFHAKNQRQIGFYVLLAACGMNLDSQNGNVLAEHMDEPLAHYLALYSSPVLRDHASQWAVSSDHWKDGYLKHLAYTHALLQRWQNKKLLTGDATRAAAEKKRAVEYVRKHKGTGFAWSLLCLMQDRAGEDKAFQRELAECWMLFADPRLRVGLVDAARYEAARSLLNAGDRKEARTAFRKLYEDTLQRDELPAIDADFRQALLGNAGEADAWGELLRKTARSLIEKKHRPAVLALARQCGQLEDLPLANQLLEMALDGVKDAKERLALQKAGVHFLQETGQLAETEALLSKLLADAELAKRPELWRMGAVLAEKRGRNVRKVECLEKALDLEFKSLPETINLESFRHDYAALLDHYQSLAEAMVALKLKPPEGFLAKVVRTADRWRAVDNDPDRACALAAGILRRLGGRDMEWEYLTTPIASKPNEAGPWAALAANLNQQGELDLSDRAYKAAFESEPTNAQILWDRAENLRQAGRPQQARALYRQLAEGTWQDRFQGLQNQAKVRVGD